MAKLASKPRPNPLLVDPTRTGMQRRALIKDINRRFERLKKEVTKLLVVDDVFGMMQPNLGVNVFCPTGPGGGVDPTCSPGGSKRAAGITSVVSSEIISDIWSKGFEKEYGMFLDDSGNILYEQVGSGTAEVDLGVPDRFNKPVIQVHTHPEESGPSDADWRLMGWESVKGMVIVSQKNVYRLEKVSADPKTVGPGKLKKTWDDFSEVAFSKVSSSDDTFAEDVIRETNRMMADKFPFIRFTVELKGNPPAVNDLVSNDASVTNNQTSNQRQSASTQLEITDKSTLKQLQLLRDLVSKEDLLKYEETPYITVRYGLHDPDAESVMTLVQQHGPIRVRLGSVSVFEGEDKGVVKIDVESAQLVSLHHHLGILPNTKTHSVYVPHITLAYVKSGTGVKYADTSGLEGAELLFRELVYSTSDDTKTTFEFGKLTNNTVWQFLTRDQQLTEFTNWLKTQVGITVLARGYHLGQLDDDHWLREHIERTYRQGMGRAFDAVKHPQLTEQLDFYKGSREEFLRSAFNNPPSVERVKLLAGRAFNELEGVTGQMGTQMSRTLVDGFIRGEGPRQIARQLHKDVDGLGKKRAEKIAFTEIVRAHNEGQLDAMEELEVEDVGVAVEWSVSGLGTTVRGNPSPCPLCKPLKGIVLKIDEARGMLPRHPYCLPGDSLISSSSRITASSERWYDGDLVTIRTSRNRVLRCTPNHPVLAPGGWVPSRLVDIGSYVVCDSGAEWEPGFDNHYNENTPSSIKRVAESFVCSGHMESSKVPLAAPDFHGDGAGSEVAVIRTDGELWSNLNSSSFKHLGQHPFVVGNVGAIGLVSSGSLTKFLKACFSTSNGFVRRLNHLFFLFNRVLAGPEPVGIGLISNRCFVGNKYSSDDRSGSAIRLGQGVLGPSGAVISDNFFSGKASAVSSRRCEVLSEDSPYDFLTDSKLFRKILKNHPRSVFLDKVISVGVNRFSGHVYNLQTDSGYYTAQGIITHNCRCSWIPAGLGEVDKTQKKTQLRIRKAIDASISAERPAAKKRSESYQRRLSSWVGKSKRISKKRPEGVL